MEILRLVVTGTVGAGKTSFVRAISDIEVVDTDRRATDETTQIKSSTTVAMDFGRLTFSPEQSLHIYGTPGQARFDFMWDLLIQRAHAYILLVAAHRPCEFRHGRKIMTFMNQRTRVPMVIGLTHMDCPDAWSEDNIAIALGLIDPQRRPPIVTVNATQPESVFNAVIVLLQELMKFQEAASVLHHKSAM
ncbi:MAG: ATP/GTP-binding protein [Cyanobacteria bacterium]|nr:ATP/GTP-binding protein [Cyanobacteriota bacterium]MDW8200522.1 ATP/GTP-binding protein [Cyanobacteriota bacterium SKYGB_h_bin112]